LIHQAGELIEYAEDLGLPVEESGLPFEAESVDGFAGDVDEWPLTLADVLADALDDAYADAGPEDLDDALDNLLDAMTPAEAFNFGKALNQIAMTAQKALADPVVGQVVRTALPIAGGAVGTFIGGPAGTAIGSSLGQAAAGALPGAPRPQRAVGAAAPVAVPPVAGGSAAAAQGLVLTQQPDVLKALLSLAMGQHGKRSANGVPVAQIMGLLSSVFGQAAADADELQYLDQEGAEAESEALDGEARYGRELYPVLLEAENAELAEAMGTP
jgi:hypothetical protein